MKERQLAFVTNDPDPVSFAVANVNRAVTGSKYTVGSGHAARFRVTFRAITAVACSSDEFQRLAADVDHSNAVTFRIREVNVPIRPDA